MITQDTTLTRTKDTMAGDVDDANDQAGKDNIDKDATFSCDSDISNTAVDAFVLETMFFSLQLQSCPTNLHSRMKRRALGTMLWRKLLTTVCNHRFPKNAPKRQRKRRKGDLPRGPDQYNWTVPEF